MLQRPDSGFKPMPKSLPRVIFTEITIDGMGPKHYKT
jgi:hypothetical protein